MTGPRILGVDPGLSGALSVVAPGADGLFKWAGIDMPRDDEGVAVEKVDAWIKRFKPDYAVIEFVTSRAGEASQNAFNFGGAAWAVRTVIRLNEIPYRVAGSLAWKNFHGLANKRSDEEKARRKLLTPQALKKLSGEDRKRAKALSRARAAELIPEDAEQFLKASSDNLAESVLIALYGLSLFQSK